MKHLLDRVAAGEELNDVIEEMTDPGKIELDVEDLHARAYEADSYINVAAALKELEHKTHEEIEHEAATLCAGRSIAAFQLGRVNEAYEYKHEALEHASQVSGDLVDQLAVRLMVEATRSEGNK